MASEIEDSGGLSSLEERLNDEGYKNWLKCGQCLSLMCHGLCKFTDKVSKQLHESIIQNIGTATCISCKSKNIKNRSITCPAKVCDRWISEILKQHINPYGTVHWPNCELVKLPTDHWEMAKCYMNGGQKNNTGPENSDSSALLNLMYACKKFHSQVPKNIVNKAKEVRNKLMHSSDMKFSKSNYESGVQAILSLLRHDALSKESDAEFSANQIEQLRDAHVGVQLSEDWVSLERTVLKEKIQCLDRDIEEQPEITDEVKKTLDYLCKFMKDNPDLYDALQSDIQGLTVKVSHLEERMDKTEARVENVEDRMSQSETSMKDLSRKLQELSIYMEKAPRVRESSQQNFKNILQHYTQTNRLPNPEYSEISSSDGKGFIGKVKVAGRLFQSECSFSKVVQAHQGAAEKALKGVGYIVDEVPSCMSVTPKTGAADSKVSAHMQVAHKESELQYKQKLGEILKQIGCADPVYSLVNTESPFEGRVTIQWKHLAQSSSPGQGKKNAEKNVSDIALHSSNIDVTKVTGATNPKDILTKYCQGQGAVQPRYYTYPLDGSTQEYHSIVYSQYLNNTTTSVSLIGEKALNKKIAFQNAAKRMLEVFAELNITGAGDLSGLATDASKSQEENPTANQKTATSSTAANQKTAASSTTASQAAPSKLPNQKTSKQPNQMIQNGTFSEKANLFGSHSVMLSSDDKSLNYKGFLQEHCQKKKMPIPVYSTDQTGTDMKMFISSLSVLYTFSMSDNHCVFPSKKESEKAVAKYALGRVFGAEFVPRDDNLCKNKLQELCVKLKQENIPKYETTESKEESSPSKFSSSVSFSLVEKSDGFPNKKDAENNVAMKIAKMMGV